MGIELSEKQNRFVCNILKGMTQTEAYREAYHTESKNNRTAVVNASRLVKTEKIRSALERRRGELAKKNIWERENALKMLKELAVASHAAAIFDIGGKPGFQHQNAAVTLKAIEQANKLCGYGAERERAEQELA
ncbi:MAG: terminase small subunit, partial [Christensenellaceae bacterium]